MADIEIKQETSGKFKPILEAIKNKIVNTDRRTEKAIVNSFTKAAIALRDTGILSLISGVSSIKLSDAGKISSVSIENKVITNRMELATDEIIVNKHRLNPKLYELTDMRQVYETPDNCAGNLTMMSTVLVKSWEPNLQKYVLIRRIARIPVFSPELNTPEIHPGIGVDNNITPEIKDANKQMNNHINEKEVEE